MRLWILAMAPRRYPDFLFRAERLIVEADPAASHDRTSSYRSDRRRDRALKRVASLDTMRFSDEDLPIRAPARSRWRTESSTSGSDTRRRRFWSRDSYLTPESFRYARSVLRLFAAVLPATAT